jgi:hypothetical protein
MIKILRRVCLLELGLIHAPTVSQTNSRWSLSSESTSTFIGWVAGSKEMKQEMFATCRGKSTVHDRRHDRSY